MSFDENIQRRFKDKGGRYTADYEQLNVRVKADHKLAVKEICVKEHWNLGNVVDWLLEGFIANYRQMWPVDGMYQMQLTQEELPIEVAPIPEPQSKPVKSSTPEYEVTARELWMFPAQGKKRRGEDVSEELAIIKDCLVQAVKNEDTRAESNITDWIQKLEGTYTDDSE